MSTLGTALIHSMIAPLYCVPVRGGELDDEVVHDGSVSDIVKPEGSASQLLVARRGDAVEFPIVGQAKALDLAGLSQVDDAAGSLVFAC